MAPARKNGAGSRESRRILHKITEKSIKNRQVSAFGHRLATLRRKRSGGPTLPDRR
jgi:hypothetical protein